MTQLQKTLLLVLAAFIWGVAFVAQTVGAEHVGTFTFLASRSWLAGLSLLPIIVWMDKTRTQQELSASESVKDPAAQKRLLTGGLVCGIFLFLASAVQQAGIPLTSTAKAGFITTMYVIIVPVFSLFLGKKVETRIWLCVLLGVAGLYLLCMNEGSYRPETGDMLILLCAVLFSFHILVIDHYSPHLDGVRLSCLQFFVTAVLSTICMFLFEQPRWADIQAAGGSILYAGILSSGAGYTLQIIGQRGLNPTIASLAMCLESVFSALAGWAVLGQVLTGREMLGCILMFGAIVWVNWPKGNQQLAEEPQA